MLTGGFTSDLARFTNAWAMWFFPGLLKSIILLGSLLLVVRLLRSASASTRHLVWVIGVFGLVVLPVMQAIVPTWHIVPIPELGAGQAPGISQLASGTALSESEGISPLEASPLRTSADDPGLQGTLTRTTPTPMTEAPPRRSTSVWIFALWLGPWNKGARCCCMSLLMFGGVIALRRSSRSLRVSCTGSIPWYGWPPAACGSSANGRAMIRYSWQA